jgi:predicted nucleic acid-binding protein
MILVDSSVWIDYFNGYNTTETTELDLLLGVEPIAIGDIILNELLMLLLPPFVLKIIFRCFFQINILFLSLST